MGEEEAWVERLEIAVTTVERDPNYLPATIESMFSACHLASRIKTLRLMVDGDDATWLGPIASRDCVIVKTRAGKDCQRMQGVPAQGRCLLNFQRAIDSATKGGPLLTLQDDLVFASCWLEKLRKLVLRIHGDRLSNPGRHAEMWVLALYAEGVFRKKPYDHYRAIHFYGNQALFWPESTREAFRSWLSAEIRAARLEPDDMMVKRFCRTHDVNLWVANPNLVDHVGRSSTVGSGFHRSRTFEF